MTASEKISALRALRYAIAGEVRDFYAAGGVNRLLLVNIESGEVRSMNVAGQGTTVEGYDVCKYLSGHTADAYVSMMRDGLSDEQKDACNEAGAITYWEGCETFFMPEDISADDFENEVEGIIEDAVEHLKVAALYE